MFHVKRSNIGCAAAGVCIANFSIMGDLFHVKHTIYCGIFAQDANYIATNGLFERSDDGAMGKKQRMRHSKRTGTKERWRKKREEWAIKAKTREREQKRGGGEFKKRGGKESRAKYIRQQPSDAARMEARTRKGRN